MEVTSPINTGSNDDSDAKSLREAPLPHLPHAKAKAHMKELMSKGDSDSGGLQGPEGANPLVQSMMALKGFETAARQAVAVNPTLSPIMAALLQQAKGSIMSGLQSLAGAAGEPMLPPPGMNPMAGGPSPMMPPPGMPPGMPGGPVTGPASPSVPGAAPIPPGNGPVQLIPPQ